MKRACILALATLAVLALGEAARAADAPHASGGVGVDERDALLAAQNDYNLKIVAAKRSGDYLADVKVVIQSAGKERMLDTTMEGPILLVKLPPDAYTISATSGRDTLSETVTVPARGLRQALLIWETTGH